MQPEQPAGDRILPDLTPENRAFWTGGANGELHIQRCEACRRWTHPPRNACGDCGGTLSPEPVSGRGSVFSFTVNHQSFRPGVATPYVIAIVELAEQADLRVPTNLVDCLGENVRCGLPVEVRFEALGEVFMPVFAPCEGA